jgi:hypothetical protein
MSNEELGDEEIESLQGRINELRIEHRDLDLVIARLSENITQDQLQLRRLKKRKLQLKDMIARLEDRMIPDILA